MAKKKLSRKELEGFIQEVITRSEELIPMEYPFRINPTPDPVLKEQEIEDILTKMGERNYPDFKGDCLVRFSREPPEYFGTLSFSEGKLCTERINLSPTGEIRVIMSMRRVDEEKLKEQYSIRAADIASRIRDEYDKIRKTTG